MGFGTEHQDIRQKLELANFAAVLTKALETHSLNLI